MPILIFWQTAAFFNTRILELSAIFCTSYNIPTPTLSPADWHSMWFSYCNCFIFHCILLYFSLFYHLFYRITVIGWSALVVVSRYCQILLLLLLLYYGKSVTFYLWPPRNNKHAVHYVRNRNTRNDLGKVPTYPLPPARTPCWFTITELTANKRQVRLWASRKWRRPSERR